MLWRHALAVGEPLIGARCITRIHQVADILQDEEKLKAEMQLLRRELAVLAKMREVLATCSGHAEKRRFRSTRRPRSFGSALPPQFLDLSSCTLAVRLL